MVRSGVMATMATTPKASVTTLPPRVSQAPMAKGSYRPFAWERGKLICAVNPAREEAELPLKLEDGTRVLHVIGKAEVKGDELVLGAQSFAILG